MRKIFLITAITFIFFLIEFVFSNFFGCWLKPNFLILLIIFVDLHLGIRYGLFVAILAGLLKDSFGIGVFGVNIFSFVLCVYVTTLARRYFFYDVEFGFLRILMAFLMSFLNIVVSYILNSMFSRIDFYQMLIFVMLPEVLATTLVASSIFKGLKRCVLKLSVWLLFLYFSSWP